MLLPGISFSSRPCCSGLTVSMPYEACGILDSDCEALTIRYEGKSWLKALLAMYSKGKYCFRDPHVAFYGDKSDLEQPDKLSITRAWMRTAIQRSSTWPESGNMTMTKAWAQSPRTSLPLALKCTCETKTETQHWPLLRNGAKHLQF